MSRPLKPTGDSRCSTPPKRWTGSWSAAHPTTTASQTLSVDSYRQGRRTVNRCGSTAKWSPCVGRRQCPRCDRAREIVEWARRGGAVLVVLCLSNALDVGPGRRGCLRGGTSPSFRRRCRRVISCRVRGDTKFPRHSRCASARPVVRHREVAGPGSGPIRRRCGARRLRACYQRRGARRP